jgi:hypothetical protein
MDFALGLVPVWLLHALLLPINGCRLLEALRAMNPNRETARIARERDP